MKISGLYKFILFFFFIVAFTRYYFIKDIKLLIIFTIIFLIILLVILFEFLINLYKNNMKKGDNKVDGIIKNIEKIDDNFYKINVTYKINDHEYSLKSELLEFNPSFLIDMYGITSLPVYYNSLYRFVDVDFLASYLNKFIEENTSLKGNEESKLSYWVNLLIIVIVLGLAIFIIHQKNILYIIPLSIILVFIYFYVYSGFSLKFYGKKIYGYVGNIEYKTDVFDNYMIGFLTTLFYPDNYFVYNVCYVYKNKIHVKRSKRLYDVDNSNINNKSFIPVYINKYIPTIAFIDISIK